MWSHLNCIKTLWNGTSISLECWKYGLNGRARKVLWSCPSQNWENVTHQLHHRVGCVVEWMDIAEINPPNSLFDYLTVLSPSWRWVIRYWFLSMPSDVCFCFQMEKYLLLNIGFISKGQRLCEYFLSLFRWKGDCVKLWTKSEWFSVQSVYVKDISYL